MSKEKMIKKGEIDEILEGYDEKQITIGVIGSHSALDICHGAKQQGFNTLVICQKGREKTYDQYYKIREGKGVVDETIILDNFSEIINPEVIKEIQRKNTIFMPHRSFEVYVGFEKIENEFRIPLFGSRSILRAEERDTDTERNQYYLMEKGEIPYPKTYKSPDDIDRLVFVKVAEAQRTYERAFFSATNPEEYKQESEKLIRQGKITKEALEKAVIEEFIVGTPVNLNFFYSVINNELELIGTDTRRQTNLDGVLRLSAPQQNEFLRHRGIQMIEAGHFSCTVKESLLEQIFELGEKFVRVARQEYPPGIIGSFALQCALVPGPPKEKFICFDISMRIPGSPGTKYTPYSEYLYNRPMSVGQRIALEIKHALEQKRLADIVT
ncbi:MAG: DUF1297 domain-containing protein [Candidatus Nealsonbacteria bacterium]|nr:DUF1297 domain-containing protein [Candidatus Nealsonbacteria bacterium]